MTGAHQWQTGGTEPPELASGGLRSSADPAPEAPPIGGVTGEQWLDGQIDLLELLERDAAEHRSPQEQTRAQRAGR